MAYLHYLDAGCNVLCKIVIFLHLLAWWTDSRREDRRKRYGGCSFDRWRGRWEDRSSTGLWGKITLWGGCIGAVSSGDKIQQSFGMFSFPSHIDGSILNQEKRKSRKNKSIYCRFGNLKYERIKFVGKEKKLEVTSWKDICSLNAKRGDWWSGEEDRKQFWWWWWCNFHCREDVTSLKKSSNSCGERLMRLHQHLWAASSSLPSPYFLFYFPF